MSYLRGEKIVSWLELDRYVSLTEGLGLPSS